MARYTSTESGLLVPDREIQLPHDDPLAKLFSDLDVAEDLERQSKATVLKRRPTSPTHERERAKRSLVAQDEDDEKLIAAMKAMDKISEDFIRTDDLGRDQYVEEFAQEYAAAAAAYNKILDSVFDSDIARVQDFTIDDSFMPRADNVYEFWTGKLFLNENPFIAQVLVLIRFFEEWCPDCSDADIFEDYDVDDHHSKVLDRLVLLENGRCPRCRQTKSDFYRDRKIRFYKELVLLMGQRAGKSYTTGACGAYVIHHYLKLPNPTAALRLSGSTQLVGSCVAMKMAQGQEALFGPIRQHLTSSQWFREYTELLDEYKRKTGKVVYKIGETLIRFRHRSISFSLEAAHQGNLRGRTRIFGAVDEIGHMAVDGGAQSGPLVHDAIDRSLKTVRGGATYALQRGAFDMMAGVQCTISSPRSQRDTINMKYREAKLDPQLLALKMATWEVNPTLPRSAFDADFAKNPVQAMCDYGAEAPASSDPFIPNPKMLLPAVSTRKLHVLPHSRKVVKVQGVNYTTATLNNPAGMTGVPKDNHRRFKRRTLFAFDAGYTDNSFALSILTMRELGTGSGYYKPDVVGLYEIIPVPQCPINFTLLFRDFVFPLAHVYRCAFMVADRWQSIKFLQDATDELEIPHAVYSLKMADFVNIRSKLYSGDVDLPKLPDAAPTFKDVMAYGTENYPECFDGNPAAHFYYQCCTVRNGAKNVDKGEGLTDDLFRATSVGIFMLDSADVQAALLDEAEEEYDDSPPPLVLSLGSGFGGSAGSGGSGGIQTDSRGAPIYVASLHSR